MSDAVLRRDLEQAAGGPAETDIPFSRMTTIGCGGPAAYVVAADGSQTLAAILDVASGYHLPWFVLGLGSNLLVADNGWRGVVIRLTGNLRECRRRGDGLECGAGASLPRVARLAWEEGLTGLEPLEGVPGTLGGAVAMNAGAFGMSIGDKVEWVEVALPGKVSRLDADQLGFAYRSCRLPAGAVVSRAALRLSPGDRDAIRRSMKVYLSRRETSQPRGVRTFGSIFRNPGGEAGAGELLDRAGCKQLSCGAAAVSGTHANFIVNSGGATAADIITLMDACRHRVHQRFGIVLEPEVRFLGDIGLKEPE